MNERDRTITDMNEEMEHLRRRVAELESRAAGDRRPGALLANEKRYQLLLDTMIHGVQENDCFGVITYSNRAHHRILGYEHGELVGKAIWELLPPGEGRGALREYLAYLVKEQPAPAPYITVGSKKDGSLVDLQIDWDYQRDDEGHLKGFISVITDITERKQAQEALRESEERLNFLVSNSPAVIFICRPSGEYGATFVTPNVQHQLGYDARTFTSNPGFWAAHIHPDDKQRIFDGLSALFAKGSHTHEYRFQHKDGTWRWMHDELRLIRDEAGDPLEIIGSWLDITDRKGTEENLLQRTKALATLLEVSKGLAATLNLADVLQATTDGITQLFGSGTAAVYLLEGETLFLGATTPPLPPHFPQKLRNAPLADHPHVRESLTSGMPVFVPDLVTADLTPAERAVTEQRDLRTVLFLPLIAGVKSVGSLIVGSVAQPRAISEAEIDLCRTLANLAALAVENALLFKSGRQYAADLEQRMAERRQAEVALQESEEKFRAVFDSASDGILVVEPRTKRFMLGNATISRMLGVGEDDIPGMRVEDIHPPEALRNVFQAFGKVARGETPFSENIPVLRKDGSVFTADISTSWIKLKGETYLAGFFRDVTERNEAEKERLELERRLLHAQKLESLGVMAGGIAHDFNNLLMAVLGNLDLALRKISPVSPARTNIEQSAQAARRAADLTRQMLAYSGKGRFVVKAMDLSELVEENAHLFRASVAKTAALNVRLDRSLPPIEADAGQVQQVIMNLITNASEAIGDKPGMITITTGAQECDAQCLKRSRIDDVPETGRFVYLEVSDNGCGMDEQTQQRLFDPFFTTKATGRGLGMSAILGIVRGHRGAIFVDSAAGRGTAIRILLPALQGAQVVNEGRVGAGIGEAPAPAMRGTVLVVDDEEIVRNVCKDMVESLGLQVLTAVDGRDGVDLFTKHADDIDLVILDLSMPNMDGMTAFKELMRIRPGLKVILSSGYDELDSIQRLSGQGLAGFIQKPYSLKSLREALERAGIAGE